MESFQENRESMVDMALESDPTAVGIFNLMDARSEWEGTTTELLKGLRSVTPKEFQKLKEFPKAPNALSNRIMRLEGFLANRDIAITRKRMPNKRLIMINKINDEARPDNGTESPEKVARNSGRGKAGRSLSVERALS